MLPIIGFLILMTSLNLNDVISQRFLNPDNIIQKFPNNDDIIQRFPITDDIYQRLPNPDDLIQMPIKYWWQHSKAFTDELNTDLTNVWAAFADLDGAIQRFSNSDDVIQRFSNPDDVIQRVSIVNWTLTWQMSELHLQILMAHCPEAWVVEDDWK
jgi:hypothetical protein